MWKITIELSMILIIATTLLIINETEALAYTCKDLILNYDSSSFCSSSKKQTTSPTSQTTILRLFNMRPLFNEGDPIVFIGKLLTKDGNAVQDAKITIIHDGVCTNKTIGYGLTDKTGKFLIPTTTKIWDPKDNLIRAHAEFSNQRGLHGSSSESKVIVVYPVKHKLC